MARNLKKFANPRFLKTCDLTLMRRLLQRHSAELHGLDPELIDNGTEGVREQLQSFFSGPEDGYPAALTADLHRIADLASEDGMQLVLQRARACNVTLLSLENAEGGTCLMDARHLALLCFLDHPQIFEAAADFLWLGSTSVTEFSGSDEGVEAKVDEESRARFEVSARRLFMADLMGGYCRTGWYEDDGEINLVVTHGTAVRSTPIVQEDAERVISYRPAGHAVLSYRREDGRLKVGGIATALRSRLAGLFAEILLDRPGFFDGEDSRNLYTLAPAEAEPAAFQFSYEFDPDCRAVRIVEVEVQRVNPPASSTRSGWEHSLLVKDRENALARLLDIAPAVRLGGAGYRLSHIVVKVEIDCGKRRPSSVLVKIKPPDRATFKRERFEGKILDILHRSGLSRDREPAKAAAAA